MELEELVEQHEDKLKQHDKELSRLNDMSVEMQKQMSEGLTRVDESNRFLREQNTRQWNCLYISIRSWRTSNDCWSMEASGSIANRKFSNSN